MEFGKLENLEGVLWDLPPDDPKNQERFPSCQVQKVFLGSPAWGVKHWVGKIYPEKTPLNRFLYYYSRYFDCIELNSSHYAIPHPDTAKLWRELVPKNFQFCPKVCKQISHSKSGLIDKSAITQWLKFLESLETNLGPCFIQFSEHFSYQDKKYLYNFLEMWPENFHLALELRHPSWFIERSIIPALGDYLHQKKIGLVITDVAGRRDILHSSLSTPWSMIRFIGNNLHPSDRSRILNWSTRFVSWQQVGVEKIYFFLHQEADRRTLELHQLTKSILSGPAAPSSMMGAFKQTEIPL